MKTNEKVLNEEQLISAWGSAKLERMYLEEYLRGKGFTWLGLLALPPEEARRLRLEASVWASLKLAEVETRAHLVRDLHGEK